MRIFLKSILLLQLLLFAGCSSPTSSTGGGSPTQQGMATGALSLTQARLGLQTKLVPSNSPKEPIAVAPPQVFRTVRYPAAPGTLAAYLSPDPGDGKMHPAIIWITGGDCNSIGDVWTPAGRDNDQTAAAYRDAGIVMMFPSLRGGNDNPGTKEGFLGEVDDVLAAADYLEKQPYVDSKRIYLGGHSTGGTLALLVVESSRRFRGVFAFGPVDDVSGYGTDSGFLPFDVSNPQEIAVRSPGQWLNSVQSPTWVLEGANQPGNIESLRTMAQASTNSKLHFLEIPGADHFSALAPTNELIAKKIVEDRGTQTQISLQQEDVNRLVS